MDVLVVLLKMDVLVVYDSQVQADFNPYDPIDQVQIFALHTASNGNCLGGMNRAFVANNLSEQYELTGANAVDDFRGWVGRAEASTEEDEYEHLAKAIGVYNSGTWLVDYSWPAMLRNYNYDSDSVKNVSAGRICHSCKYSIEIRGHAFGLDNLRKYLWLGGIATADINTDTDPEPEILAGQEWCFVYGEEDWVSGATVFEGGSTISKAFRHYREDALDDDNLKIACE